MPVEAGSFKATIPATAVKPPIIEYYVQASDSGGLAIGTRGDSDTPLRVAVRRVLEFCRTVPELVFALIFVWSAAVTAAESGPARTPCPSA